MRMEKWRVFSAAVTMRMCVYIFIASVTIQTCLKALYRRNILSPTLVQFRAGWYLGLLKEAARVFVAKTDNAATLNSLVIIIRIISDNWTLFLIGLECVANVSNNRP